MYWSPKGDQPPLPTLCVSHAPLRLRSRLLLRPLPQRTLTLLESLRLPLPKGRPKVAKLQWHQHRALHVWSSATRTASPS